MLQCATCGERKNESEFGVQRNKTRGYRYSCKECTNKKDRARYQKKKAEGFSEEEILKKKQYSAEYYLKNKDKYLEYTAKSNAKKRATGRYRTPERREKSRRQYNKTKDTPRNKIRIVRKNINGRCNNPQNKDYKYYGGRGIKCERKTFGEFYNDMFSSFLKHIQEYGMGIKYTQIDRIDNDGNYCKENCRRVTALENNPANHSSFTS